jgi:hypothetical protein
VSPRGRLVVAVLSLAGLGGTVLPTAGQPPVWVRVPHRGGAVFVPLDPSGSPLGLPDAESPGGSSPAAPASPRAPGIPAAPGAPRSDPGFLLVETDPVAATIHIDGSLVVTAEVGGGPERLIALAPGTHRVDVAHPGFLALTTSVRIVPRHTSVLRPRLTPEIGATAPGTGYSVVPAR